MSQADLDSLVAEATVDCADDSECITGFFTLLDEHLGVPFPATVHWWRA